MNTKFFKKRPHLIPAIIMVLLLLGAWGNWPYGYYQFLRLAVCGVGIYLIEKWEKLWALLLFGFIVILFNPIIPIHLPKDIWQMIDLALSVIFFIVGFIPMPSNIGADLKKGIASLNAGESYKSVYPNSPVDGGKSNKPNIEHPKPTYWDFG